MNYDYLEFIKHSVFAGKIVILKAILMLHSFSAEALLQPFRSGFGEEAETNKAGLFPRVEAGSRTLKVWANPVSEF